MILAYASPWEHGFSREDVQGGGEPARFHGHEHATPATPEGWTSFPTTGKKIGAVSVLQRKPPLAVAHLSYLEPDDPWAPVCGAEVVILSRKGRRVCPGGSANFELARARTLGEGRTCPFVPAVELRPGEEFAVDVTLPASRSYPFVLVTLHGTDLTELPA